MNPKVIHSIGLVLAVVSGVLAISDQLSLISALNTSFAHAWPVVLASATALDRLDKLFVPASSNQSSIK